MSSGKFGMLASDAASLAGAAGWVAEHAAPGLDRLGDAELGADGRADPRISLPDDADLSRSTTWVSSTVLPKCPPEHDDAVLATWTL